MLINTRSAMHFYLVWRPNEDVYVSDHIIEGIHRFLCETVRHNFDFTQMTDATHGSLLLTLPRAVDRCKGDLC